MIKNPYSVLSERISYDNLQQISEMITLHCLKSQLKFGSSHTVKLYHEFINDLNRLNDKTHRFSDAYDLTQEVIYFLYPFIGYKLSDEFVTKKGKTSTIKHAAYNLICRNLGRIKSYSMHNYDIEFFNNKIKIDLEFYTDKDYTEVDKKVKKLKLTKTEKKALDGYLVGLPTGEIANFLKITRSAVYQARKKIQKKYETIFLKL